VNQTVKSREVHPPLRIRADPKAYRKRTAFAIRVWSGLPVVLCVLALSSGNTRAGGLFAATIVLALVASSLAQSPRMARQFLAMTTLAVAAIPFTVWFIRGVRLSRGTGAAAVAGSPAAYLVNAFCELLFAVPLLAFAHSLWRHRSEDR
jgi:hypothetical protein